MAQDTIDAAVQAHGLKAGSSKTIGLQLQGAEDWSPTLYIRLVQDYGLESEVSCGFCGCPDVSATEGFVRAGLTHSQRKGFPPAQPRPICYL